MDIRFLPETIEGKLARLSEECHEVGQAACKAIRFGLYNTDPRTGITNIEKMQEEMEDLIHAWDVILTEVLENTI